MFLEDSNDASFESLKYDQSERDERNKCIFYKKSWLSLYHQAKM
jgi:hypothetical protein